ncbi:hypothetical protein NDU88_003904 [Pleurodeles waltl]|uniref:Uncharacterized protein n=1 Tax=Pleurodeles waltl TaxID=8319 RepID=A0AAV7L0D2_PLEWA|nr:hypothetical protein NDU88_003904 [Pleurodeles waltl]
MGRRQQRVESRGSCPGRLARARSEGRSGRPLPPHDSAGKRPSAAGSEILRRPEPRSSRTAELPTGDPTGNDLSGPMTRGNVWNLFIYEMFMDRTLMKSF